MSRTDLLSDGLTILRNGVVSKKDDVSMPYSGLLAKVFDVLKAEGYIENFRKIEENNKASLKVYLKYVNKKSVISKIRRISKPSLRVYVQKDKVPSVLKGRGLALVSTPQGLLTDKQARANSTGGEVLFYIW